jgi:membrane magnesium transporter 1
MASAIEKFLVAIGLLALLHAAYSAAQHRAYLRLTEQEFTMLPADVLIQTLVGLFITCCGIVQVVGKFREIRPIADLETRTWDSMSTHVAFYSFNHRGNMPGNPRG